MIFVGVEYNYADPKYAQLARELIDADPVNLGHIDVDGIAFLNRSESKPKVPMRISLVKEPYILLCNKYVIIEISEELCNQLSPEHLELTMYRMLRHISPEFGKLTYPDVREYSDLLIAFGWDWQEQVRIPSILEMLRNTRTQAVV